MYVCMQKIYKKYTKIWRKYIILHNIHDNFEITNNVVTFKSDDMFSKVFSRNDKNKNNDHYICTETFI